MLSPLAARKAEKLGYKNVKVFHAGIPAWKKAGNPMVSNIAGLEGYIKADASYILIDMRPTNVIEKGHIPKAVGLPQGGIDALKDQFPKHKAAPIILYTQHGLTDAAKDAYKKIGEWGYTQVSLLIGGFDAWEKASKEIAKGPAAPKITYVRKLQPGEIDIETLKAMVAKPIAGSVLLDVRTAGEAAEGLLPGAVNVPLDQLEQRAGELPKDKNIVVHCATGARAEMGHNILKNLGLKSGYVKAKVEFDKEKKGEFKIEE